jgi:hypothetical protein
MWFPLVGLLDDWRPCELGEDSRKEFFAVLAELTCRGFPIPDLMSMTAGR